VEGDAEALLDESGDTVGSPQLVGPAVLFGALAEEAFEFAQLVVGESGRGTGDGSCVQSVGLLSHASPAMNGRGADAENAGDDGRRFALLDEFDGAAAAAFEFS